MPEPLLERYLADRDAACPSCGYNLRGAVTDTCPECGRKLELALRDPSPLWRRRGLLLLVFAWLLLAGGMNAARQGEGIYRAANAGPQVALTRFLGRGPGTGQIAGLAQQYYLNFDGNVSVTTTPGTEVRTTLDPLTVGTPLLERGTPPDTRLPGDPGPAPNVFTWTVNPAPGLVTNPGPAWSNVRWTQWAHFGGWTAMFTLAVVGLVLLFRERRREASPAVVRTLITLAWIGFGGYFAYHVSVFVREWG